VILQHKVFCKLKKSTTREGEEVKSDIITFHFYLGPCRIACIVNIPRSHRDSAPVYIQTSFHLHAMEWTLVEKKDGE
jgi:hypothetical protein